MLYHVPDLGKAISEVSRVLKRDGRFYATTNGNNGLMSFLHKSVKIFDPETTLFSEMFSFNLENGGETLRKYFKNVIMHRYEGALAVTEAQGLVDWIESSINLTKISEGMIVRLHDYFEGIIKREGAVNIPKEAGLFIGTK
jgi:ubiquinone/menaquinone biosynthesis C-methylase UbiE